MIQFALSFIGALGVAWSFPHYFAPLTATIYILLIQMLRHLRQWKIAYRPVGVYLTRLIVVLALARPIVVVGYAMQHPVADWRNARAQIITRLNALPGQHLILVSYRPDHYVEHEWVYNAADIDGAKIVWARVIPGMDLKSVLEYFKDRRVWQLNADAPPLEVHPCAAADSTTHKAYAVRD